MAVDTNNTPFAECAKYCGAAVKITNEDGTPSISLNSGKFSDLLETLEAGFYTIYIKSSVEDNPATAKAINSSLRGIVHNALRYGAPTAWANYIYAIIFDKAGNAYAQYVNGYGGSSGWVQLNAVSNNVLTVGETTVTEEQLKALLKMIQ